MKPTFLGLARRYAPFIAGIAVGAVAMSASASLRGSSVFPDVPSGSYYDTAVGSLNAAGVIKGSNGLFHPADYVSRADVAVMLARLRADITGQPYENGSSSSVRRSSSSSSSSSSVSTSSTSSSSSSASSAYNSHGYFRFTTTSFSVDKNLSKVTISVVRTGGNEGTVMINYKTTDGTAVVGTDYTTASGTLVLPNKTTSATFTVNIVSGRAGTRSFNVVLSNPQNGAGLATPFTASVNIVDPSAGSTSSTNSSTPNSSSSNSVSSGPVAGTLSLSATAYAMNEKNGVLTVTVLRSGGSQGSVNVNYATSNGSAQSGSDYNGTSGTLSFGAGETSKTFSITALDNASITGNKNFTLALSSPTGGGALDSVQSSATVTIFDDESGTYGSGSLKFSKANYDTTNSAGKVAITVMRTGGANGVISVQYATTNGTAFSGVDYTDTRGTLTFQSGEASKVIYVPIIKGSALGDARVVNLALANATSPAVLVSPYTGTITIYH